MRGHEKIIEVRMQGLKPQGWVHVDVSRTSDQAWLLGSVDGRNYNEVSPGVPMSLYVCLSPSESSLTADWSWSVGLKLQVDGDDEVRVAAAHEKIVAAGAARVVSTCTLHRYDVRVWDSGRVWK